MLAQSLLFVELQCAVKDRREARLPASSQPGALRFQQARSWRQSPTPLVDFVNGWSVCWPVARVRKRAHVSPRVHVSCVMLAWLKHTTPCMPAMGWHFVYVVARELESPPELSRWISQGRRSRPPGLLLPPSPVFPIPGPHSFLYPPTRGIVLVSHSHQRCTLRPRVVAGGTDVRIKCDTRKGKIKSKI